MKELFAGKQFWIILVAWFVFAYAVLWFIGGGCTDILSGGTCISATAVQGLAAIPIVNLLLPFNQWFSMMYWFAPIAGFVFAYFAIRWYTEYYDSKFAVGPWVVVLILLALFVGYYINLSWYYGESAKLNSRNGISYELYFCLSETDSTQCSTVVNNINQQYISIAQSTGATTIKQLIPIQYWSELRQSIYLTFLIGALLAWVPLFVKNFVVSRKE